MKVLQIIDQLNVGGAERVAVDLSILLNSDRFVVEFLSLLSPSALDENLKKNNINIHYLNRANKYNLFKLIRLFCLLNKFKIIHVHSRHVLRYIALTFLLPNFFRKYKVVFHDHYGNIDLDPTCSNYLKWSISHCDAYIGVSKGLTKWAKFNNLNRRIFLLENIVRSFNKETKSKTNELIIVGNFRPQKNYEFLIQVIENLPSSVKIDIYGSIVDRHYYEYIKKMLCDLKRQGQINIIIDEKDVASILSNYKLALHVAKSETGPLVAIEYIMAGLPFIMYNTGSIANKMKQYDYDLIMDTFEKKEWSDKIIQVLNDENYQIKLKAKLDFVCETHFSEEKYVEKCKEIYQSIMSC